VAEVSAGVLAWRRGVGGPEFLLVHPGGPFWRGKDEAAWSIPKGLVEPGEDRLEGARREFAEELGQTVHGDFVELAACRTSSGKTIHAWLIEADLDLTHLRSNLFRMEWPPRSGRLESFPEVDRAEYFDPETALWRLHKGQRPILAEAIARLAEA